MWGLSCASEELHERRLASSPGVHSGLPQDSHTLCHIPRERTHVLMPHASPFQMIRGPASVPKSAPCKQLAFQGSLAVPNDRGRQVRLVYFLLWLVYIISGSLFKTNWSPDIEELSFDSSAMLGYMYICSASILCVPDIEELIQVLCSAIFRALAFYIVE